MWRNIAGFSKAAAATAAARTHGSRRCLSTAIPGPCIVHKRGADILHDPWFNKDTGFPLTERDRLGLRGLLPPRVISFEQQYARFIESFRSLERNTQGQPDNVVSLAKWRILNRLHDRNETLYYRVLIDNIKDFAPIIYTPTVGLVCQNYSGLYRRPRGMYFSAKDKGEMMSMIYNWPAHQVDMIVITDGSRILGLGDLGVQGIGIPIGKLDMYVAVAGINPQRVLPIMLDVGTNNQKLLQNPLYLGLRQPRLEGEDFRQSKDFEKMVQRKTCQATESYNLQPETRFGQEHVKSLGPEMMTMKKRTKPKRKVIDSSVSQSGKPQTPPKKHDLVAVKGTGMSPNYMKGTSSSEARKENKSRLNQKKNQTGPKHDSRHGVIKEKSIKKPSSRMVRGLTKAPSFKRCSQRATCSSTLKDSKFPDYLMLHDDEAVSGTSVLKVCPYTYCSLNGHLHKQYPPLKSFISSRRRSLKSQKKASKEEVVEMYVEEKKESIEADVVTQISEALSEGAPRSETDSDGYTDTEETFVADSVKEMQETHEADDYYSEGEHGTESIQSDSEESLVDDSVKETSCQVNDDSDSEEMVRVLEGDHDLEETLLDDSMKEIQENSEADESGEETLNDNKTEDQKEELQDQTEETTKVPYNRTPKPCNQEESDATMSWTIKKGKKPVEETEDLKEFNPREPNYLPLVPDADAEKVDLKHQDIDERRNSEDWMFDYALQRTVTKLSSARKRKVALLVEAFETVKPVMPRGREPAPVMSYGRHLQTCN